jgi:hypothetical protein
MDAPSATPPTPLYSIPPTGAAAAAVGAPPHAPNPSAGADMESNSSTARALFMPPRPNLHTSATAAQVRPTAPPAKGKATAPDGRGMFQQADTEEGEGAHFSARATPSAADASKHSSTAAGA